jgi:hypothetical protein
VESLCRIFFHSSLFRSVPGHPYDSHDFYSIFYKTEVSVYETLVVVGRLLIIGKLI